MKELPKLSKQLREKENFAKVIHNRLISLDVRQTP